MKARPQSLANARIIGEEIVEVVGDGRAAVRFIADGERQNQ